jgi:hypothetical protein
MLAPCSLPRARGGVAKTGGCGSPHLPGAQELVQYGDVRVVRRDAVQAERVRAQRHFRQHAHAPGVLRLRAQGAGAKSDIRPITL